MQGDVTQERPRAAQSLFCAYIDDGAGNHSDPRERWHSASKAHPGIFCFQTADLFLVLLSGRMPSVSGIACVVFCTIRSTSVCSSMMSNAVVTRAAAKKFSISGPSEACCAAGGAEKVQVSLSISMMRLPGHVRCRGSSLTPHRTQPGALGNGSEGMLGDMAIYTPAGNPESSLGVIVVYDVRTSRLLPAACQLG